MKIINYLLGVAFVVMAFTGLYWFGMQLPLGANPHSYEDIGRTAVYADSFVTKKMHGIREILCSGNTNTVTVNVIIRTTDDDEACGVTYPKDLIKVTRSGGVLRCTVTKKCAALDVFEKHRLVHKYSYEEMRLLLGRFADEQPYSMQDEREIMEDRGQNLFVYITVKRSLWAIENDNDFQLFLVDAKLKSLGCYNNGYMEFCDNTQIDYLYSSWYGFDLGRAHIKKMEVEANGYVSFDDDRCRVDTLLITGKGNVKGLTFRAYGTVKLQEKAYGDLTYSDDSIPLARVIRNKFKN